MTSRFLGRPYLPFAVLLIATVAGGLLFNTIHAHGRLIAEGTGEPIKDATLAYGGRQYHATDQGEFDIPDLPRGARITALAPGWTRKEFSAEDTEVRLTVGVVNFNVYSSATNKLISKPEAHDSADPTKVLGVGTETGSIAVPTPPSEILICATDHIAQTVKITRPIIDVTLELKLGQKCPQPPAPSPSPSPSASAAPSASPAATPTPSASP